MQCFHLHQMIRLVYLWHNVCASKRFAHVPPCADWVEGIRLQGLRQCLEERCMPIITHPRHDMLSFLFKMPSAEGTAVRTSVHGKAHHPSHPCSVAAPDTLDGSLRDTCMPA